MESIRVLIVAFDGLDYELIQEYGCENLMQQEFGRIDNDTGISRRSTSELFASFITGELHDAHGVTGLKKWNHPRGRLADILIPERLRRNVRGFQRLYETLKALLDVKKVFYRKEDLQCDTLFEKVPNAEPMFVPSYNPSISMEWIIKPLWFGASVEETAENWEREFRYRKEELFSRLVNGGMEDSLLMCHIHKSDTWQHLFTGDKGIEDYDRIEEMYSEMNEFAQDIKDAADFDTIIFMSDHGVPMSKEHNENAFYSCNRELFPDTEPHITDFHDRILELTGQAAVETADLDI